MCKKTNLSEMERNRINELRFRALVMKMLNNTKNDLYTVIEYIKHISVFLNFNVEVIVGIIKEIIDTRYVPTIDEVIKINLLLGVTIREIADKLNMKESTVKMHIYRNQNNINTIILYPRLKEQQLQELRRFLKQYYSLYVPLNRI